MAVSYVFGANPEEAPREAPGHAARPGKHEAASRTPSAGPKPSTNTTTNAECELRALDLAYRARLWIDENPDAWAFMVSRALHEAKAHRRFGSKQLVEEARRKDFADVRGRRTRISNTLTPAFARILAAEHPECRPFVTMKPSAVDGAL